MITLKRFKSQSYFKHNIINKLETVKLKGPRASLQKIRLSAYISCVSQERPVYPHTWNDSHLKSRY